MIRSLTMPRLAAGTALAAIAAAGSAHAGALEQVVPSTIRLLYEEGRYVEFNAVYADPEQSGDGINVPPNPACRMAASSRATLATSSTRRGTSAAHTRPT